MAVLWLACGGEFEFFMILRIWLAREPLHKLPAHLLHQFLGQIDGMIREKTSTYLNHPFHILILLQVVNGNMV
jgi:hypothetical protein